MYCIKFAIFVHIYYMNKKSRVMPTWFLNDSLVEFQMAILIRIDVIKQNIQEKFQNIHLKNHENAKTPFICLKVKVSLHREGTTYLNILRN